MGNKLTWTYQLTRHKRGNQLNKDPIAYEQSIEGKITRLQYVLFCSRSSKANFCLSEWAQQLVLKTRALAERYCCPNGWKKKSVLKLPDAQESWVKTWTVFVVIVVVVVVHSVKKNYPPATTMLFTSTNVLFPGHNHLLTTGAEDLTVWLSPEHQRVW